MCLFISLSLSPLSSRLATNMYRAGSVYAFARGLWTVSGPCRLEVAFSFNPFVFFFFFYYRKFKRHKKLWNRDSFSMLLSNKVVVDNAIREIGESRFTRKT